MQIGREELAATQSAAIDAAAGLARIQFAALERLTALSFRAARATLDDGAGYAKALLDARDAQRCLELSAEHVPPALQNASSYVSGCLEAGIGAHAEITGFLEAGAFHPGRMAAQLLTQLAKYIADDAGMNTDERAQNAEGSQSAFNVTGTLTSDKTTTKGYSPASAPREGRKKVA